MTEEDAAKLKQRAYHREKRRHYRKLEMQEVESLKNRIRELEAEITEITSTNAKAMLSWKEIAAALAQEAKTSIYQRRLLSTRKKNYSELAKRMTEWVTSHTAVRKSIDESYQSWRNTTLFTETESRKLGFDWITKQMFYNADRVFIDCDFPPPHDLANFEDFTIRESIDDSFQYIWRHQVVLPISMKQAVAGMRLMVLNFAKGAVWSPGNGILMDQELLEEVGREIVYGHTQVNELEAVNVLCRQFSPSDNKCVFVSQNILDDEALPFIQRQCNRRFWIMLHSIQDNTTVCQTLYANSQFFTKEGFVSLDEEAACWGYEMFPQDLSLEDQEIVFKRHAKFVGTNFLSYNNQTFHATSAMVSES